MALQTRASKVCHLPVLDPARCQYRRVAAGARTLACLALPIVASLMACTTVRIESTDRQVRVEHHWGVLAVTVEQPQTSLVAEITGIGLIQSPWGWSAGYTNQSWAALGPECRLVIWINSPDQMDAAARLADPKAGICVPQFLTPKPEVPHHAD